MKKFEEFSNSDLIIESERLADELIEKYEIRSIEDLNESIIGKIFGGTTGFLLGPTVGKIICKVLGIKDGPLADLLTSRLVSTALGIAIAKELGGEYPKRK